MKNKNGIQQQFGKMAGLVLNSTAVLRLNFCAKLNNCASISATSPSYKTLIIDLWLLAIVRNLNPGSLNSPSLFLQYTPIPINYLTTQFCEIFKIQTRKYHLSLNLIK